MQKVLFELNLRFAPVTHDDAHDDPAFCLTLKGYLVLMPKCQPVWHYSSEFDFQIYDDALNS